MKASVEVQLANAGGKKMKLEVDTLTGEVEITTPVMWKTPKVNLGALELALEELKRLQPNRELDRL